MEKLLTDYLIQSVAPNTKDIILIDFEINGNELFVKYRYQGNYCEHNINIWGVMEFVYNK
jgi:hypothetical protein